MPRIQHWSAINNPARHFTSTADYLHYLRVRRRVRMSRARLAQHREIVLSRLHAVRECSSWDEITAFLNANASDITAMTDERETCEGFGIKIDREHVREICWHHEPITMEGSYDDFSPYTMPSFPAWEGSLTYRYGGVPRKRIWAENHHLQENFDLPMPRNEFSGVSDVLKEIGIEVGSGGGMVGRGMKYKLVVWQQDFDHMRVLIRIAA